MYGHSLPFFLSFVSLVHAKPHPQYWGAWRPGSPSPSSTAILGAIPATVVPIQEANIAGSALPSSSTIMGGSTPLTPIFLSSTSPNSPLSPGSNPGGSSGAASLPSNCWKLNGVGVGWLPGTIDISTLESQVSTSPPCTYGTFAQILSGTSMPDAQMAGGASSASNAGAVYHVALQPWVPFSSVSASAVAASMQTLSHKLSGQIWLRLAHEVNWYIDTNTANTDARNKYHGTPAEYKTMWNSIASLVDRSKVKMFWTPVPPFGGATVASLHATWYPGDAGVDVVGLDAYAQPNGDGSNPTFQQTVGAFCQFYLQKPFHLGETGWRNGGTPQQKTYWWGQVSGQTARSVCPNYLGFSWFEFDKPGDGDYTIVSGSAGNLLKGAV